MDPRSAIIRSCIDELAAAFADRPVEGEIRRARQAFDARRGRIYDDDALYDTHMALFLEWFALERPVSSSAGAPPVALHLAGGEMDDERQAVMWAQAHSQRSLFEVAGLSAGAMELADLVYGGRWRVSVPVALPGTDTGDIFEGRLLPWEGEVRLGPTMLFHPREARGRIHALLAESALAGGRPHPALVDDLAEMCLRHSRFRNIAVAHIYRLTDASRPR